MQVVQPNQIIIMLTIHVRMTVFIVLLHWVSCTIKFLGGFGAVWQYHINSLGNINTALVVQVVNVNWLQCQSLLPLFMLLCFTLAALYIQCEAGILTCTWWVACGTRTPYFSAIESNADISPCQFGGKFTRGTSVNYFCNHIVVISVRIAVIYHGNANVSTPPEQSIIWNWAVADHVFPNTFRKGTVEVVNFLSFDN